MRRILLFAVLLASCAGTTVPDEVTATAVSGTPQAVIEGINRGSSVLVEVKLNNPTAEPIQITGLTMTVLTVEPKTCPSTALALLYFPKPIIAASSSGSVVVRLGVAASSKQACSKARWHVSFASTAIPAS